MSRPPCSRRVLRPDDFLPLTLSVRSESPYFRDDVFSLGGAIIITLDGVEQRRVIEYDVPAGTLTRYVLDAEGNLRREPSRRFCLEETLHGEVRVFWKARAA